MIAVLYLLTFVAGAAAGAAYAYWWVDHYTTADVSRYTYLRTGYHDGHHDGVLGIWRGGPLR